MKWLLLSILPLPSLCQVTSIGIFKIGLTYEQTAGKLADEKGLKVYQSSSYGETYGSNPGPYTTVIYEVLNRESMLFCKEEDGNYITGDLSIIFIDCYQISGLKVKKLFLKYWKNKLYSIECDGSSDLTDAVHIKYGKGKSEIKENIITCQNGFGATFYKEELIAYERWISGNIEARDYFHKGYNDKCEKEYFTLFTIEDRPTSKLVESKIDAIKSSSEAKEKKSARERLKDF